MGYLSALDMSQNASLEQALSWHFSSNCYPPLPQDFIEPAKQAIELANHGAWDAIVDLPEDSPVEHRRYGKHIPVNVLIESLHLDAFLEE